MEKISSLYIHFPYCMRCCNDCVFHRKKFLSRDEIRQYEQLLNHQYSSSLKLLEKKEFEFGKLKTIYIGGGTPSLWSFEGVKYLDSFLQKFSFESDFEFTLEVNPAQINKEELSAWREIGVNRISMGLQAFSDPHLKLLDRTHSTTQARQTLKLLRDSEINFSVDLLLGIPGSENRDLIGELNSVLEYGPGHLSLYILTVKDDYPMSSALPDENAIASEYLECAQYLTQKGFGHYEVSNFALAGRESLHNLQYWQTKSVAALGPSATGLLSGDVVAWRYRWGLDGSCIQEDLTSEELALEKQYMRLRTNLGTLLEVAPKQLEKLILCWNQKGYLIDTNKTIRLTSKGYLFLDSIMDDIFACDKML